MTWDKGRDVIHAMLAKGHLEQIPANPDEVEYLIASGRRHLASATLLADSDPELGYDAVYAAARKALTALLWNQGLRPTRAGGHEAVIEAAQAQYVPPLGEVLRPFRRLRGKRHGGDYLASEGLVTPEDVLADLPVATKIVDAAETILPNLTVFVPSRN